MLTQTTTAAPRPTTPGIFFAFAVKQITFILIQVLKGTIDKQNFVIGLFQIHVSLKAVVLRTISAAK